MFSCSRGRAALLAVALLPAHSIVVAQNPFPGFAEIAGGSEHTCARTAADEVYCWGENANGQLGSGGADSSLVPLKVTGLPAATALSVGRSHSCALGVDQGVYCWGQNFRGQLGVATPVFSAVPLAVSGIPGGARSVAAGDEHSCAVSTAGGAYCWGHNSRGQLGDGSQTASSTPRPVTGLGSGVDKVDVGDEYSCAKLVGGGVRCWGRNAEGQLGDGTTVDASTPVTVLALPATPAVLQVMPGHSCVIDGAGALRCWGRNFNSEIGIAGAPSVVSTAIAGPNLGSPVLSLAGGFGHTCAQLANGRLWCWGNNSVGQIGDGVDAFRPLPVEVTALGFTAVVLGAGSQHNCAASATRVACWGSNLKGQLGNARAALRPAPGKVLALTRPAVSLALGGLHSCAVLNDNQAQCWGLNDGSLGNGSTADSALPVAVQNEPSGWAEITAGSFHTCGRTQAGAVKCWGYSGGFGALGSGGAFDRNLVPTPVQGLASGVVSVRSIGTGNHTCALTSGGGVTCWGINTDGQLGNNSTTFSAVPVDVSGLGSGASAIAIGAFHSCALMTDQSLRCWGLRSQYSAAAGNALTPEVVAGVPADLVAISGPCGIRSSGALYCWGDTDTAPANFGTDVSRLVHGSGFSCALDDAAMLRCAGGGNTFGSLGDGTRLGRTIPVLVAGVVPATAAAAGALHACAIAQNGDVFCWGANDIGQLGIGQFGIARVPTLVLDDTPSRQVSASTAGASGDSLEPSSDASGRYVVFRSAANGLVPGDSNGSEDIFRRDQSDGSVARVSLDNGGDQITADSIEPAVSGDGQLIAFVAPDAGVAKLLGESKSAADKRRKAGSSGVFLRNMLTGTTQRIGNAPLSGSGGKPQIAAGGGAVVFAADVDSLAQGQTGQTNVFRVALARMGNTVLPDLPVCLSCRSTSATGVATGDNADGPSRNPTLSADGQWVAFESEAKNVVAGQPPGCPQASTQIVLRNVLTGQTRTIGGPSNALSCGAALAGSGKPQMDFSAARVVFESTQPLVGNDRNGESDIYSVDVRNGQVQRISQSPDGIDGNGAAFDPRISGDGMTISFASTARNLEPRETDNNERADLHVFSLRSQDLRRLTRNGNGDQADQDSLRPALNYMGNKVSFDSTAANLDDAVQVGVRNVFVRDNPLDVNVVFAAGFD